jgi:hypothetical protein
MLFDVSKVRLMPQVVLQLPLNPLILRLRSATEGTSFNFLIGYWIRLVSEVEPLVIIFLLTSLFVIPYS